MRAEEDKKKKIFEEITAEEFLNLIQIICPQIWKTQPILT